MANKIASLLLCFVLFLTACKKESVSNPAPTPAPNPTPTPTPTVPQDNDNMLMGNPTGAQNVASFSDNYLLNHLAWIASYSNSRGIANWVSWHLQSEDLGSAPRQNDFRYDETLPTGYYLVQNTSYSGSGFDRGHNCPSADRTSSIGINSLTFYMTNMIPQAPKFNQGPWGAFEDFIRTTLVGTTKEAYVIMGNYGSGGIAVNTPVTTIDNGHVTVPRQVWKVLVILPKGNNDLSRINDSTTIVAVNMPNNNLLYSTDAAGKLAWKNYITTINSIEQDAASEGMNLNLLSAVNATVRATLKNKLYQ